MEVVMPCVARTGRQLAIRWRFSTVTVDSPGVEASE
jgi:hypothetical protein